MLRKNQLLFIILLFIFPQYSYAKKLLVNQDGSGDYAGIAEALEDAKSGDTILIKAGDYRESLVIKKDNISLQGEGMTKTKIIAKEAFGIWAKGVSGLRIEGLSIISHTTTGHAAILLIAAKADIRQCLIRSKPNGYGIFAAKGSEATLEYNTIVGNQNAGGVRFDGSCRLFIKHNIITGNSFGINNQEGSCAAHISYNDVWKNGKDYAGCSPGKGNISKDPRFVDRVAGNYQLKKTSPCLHAGEKGQAIGAQARPKPVASPPSRPVKTPAASILPPKLELKYTVEEDDPDGVFNPGEKIELKIKVKNIGEGKAEKVWVKFTSPSPGLKSFSREMGALAPNQEKEISVILYVAPGVKDGKVKAALRATAAGGHKSPSKEMKVTFLVPKPPPPPPPPTGSLKLSSIPSGAEVYRDGKKVGITPLSLAELKPGKYNWELKLKGYHQAAAQVEIAAKKETIHKVELKKRDIPAAISITSQPASASVYLNSHFKGTTPLSIEELRPGELKFKLKLLFLTPDKGLKYEKQITLKSGRNQLHIDRFTRIIPPTKMAFIPAGEFQMGGLGRGAKDERPPHKVWLEGFFMDYHEVTNAEFDKYILAGGAPAPPSGKDINFNAPSQPVAGITHAEADKFCRLRGKRLPTEAEWEKAAGGDNPRTYPWGTAAPSGRANLITPDNYPYTAPVASFPAGASPYGLQDMAGNVWEWCSDWYAKDYYSKSPAACPGGPDTGKYKVLRGGSWDSPGYDARVSRRWRYDPNSRRNYIGFRCAWSL